jgi:hypothetical protein
LGQKLTGLDLIEKLNLASNAILVTSRFEDEKIRQRCAVIGVRLIPKAMASLVPIEVTSTWKALVDSNHESPAIDSGF